MQTPAEAVYRKQHDTHTTLKRLLKKRNRIGWLRLAVLVIAIIAVDTGFCWVL
jgi:hypothetical protein